MFNRNASKMATAIFAALALSACGGSSGGENGNGGGNIPPPSIAFSSANIDLQETGEATISFTLSDAGASAIISASSNSDLVKVAIENKNQLRIETLRVNNDTPVTISLEVKFGGQSSTTNVDVNIINSSIIPVFEEIDALISLLSSGYQDEQQLFNYTLQVGYLSGAVSRSKVDALKEQFNESLQSIGGEVLIADAITSLLDNYTDSTIGEPDLIAGISELVVQYNEKIKKTNIVVNTLFDDVGMQFPNLKLTGNIYHPDVKRFSQLLTDNVGGFSGEFKFNDEYAFLGDVLPSFNNNQQCLITEEGA